MIELKSWPSGVVRFGDGILELTNSDLRVHVRDIERLTILPPKMGRVSLEVRYRAGLNTNTTSAWVETGEEKRAAELVAAVQAARG